MSRGRSLGQVRESTRFILPPPLCRKSFWLTRTSRVGIATEIDDVSYESAVANIARNGLCERVRVVKAKEGGRVLSPLFDDVTSGEMETKFVLACSDH